MSVSRDSQHTPTTISKLTSPATWDLQSLEQNWLAHLEEMARAANMPRKRLQVQVDQGSIFQETMRRWEKMEGRERLDAWKRLIEASERYAGEILPACVQCGECCLKGSPTLQTEDLDLLRQGKLPWNQLITLRRGEPVHSPFKDGLFFLLDERIKLREKPGTKECVFFDGEASLCTIYENRPIQCRAQACWDSTAAKQLAELSYLTRRDIFQEVELLSKLIAEHDSRCSFESLHNSIKRMEDTRGESVQEVIKLLAYEEHFRSFLAEQLNIPEDTLDLVFGRSFSELVSVFGFRVDQEPDGSRCLVIDRPDNGSGS